MAARILNFRKLFRQREPQAQPFKYRHFLNSLPKTKVEEIVLFSEADSLMPLIPAVNTGHTLFFNDQRHKYLLKKLIAKEPSHFLNLVTDGEEMESQSPGQFTLLADKHKLPIKPASQDIAVYPGSISEDQLDARMIQSLSALLKNGGRLLVSVCHPSLELLLFNQNPSETGAPDNSMAEYFRLFKESHLYLEDMSEGRVNQGLKPFFTVDGEFDHYHEYKGTPLVVAFRLVKYKKK